MNANRGITTTQLSAFTSMLLATRLLHQMYSMYLESRHTAYRYANAEVTDWAVMERRRQPLMWCMKQPLEIFQGFMAAQAVIRLQ